MSLFILPKVIPWHALKHIRKMGPQSFKHLQSHKPYCQRHCPKIDGQLRPHPKPIPGQHTVPISCRYIVKGIQLQKSHCPGRLICKHTFMIHDRCQPHSELKTYADNLCHIFKKHIYRRSKITNPQRQQGSRQRIV